MKAVIERIRNGYTIRIDKEFVYDVPKEEHLFSGLYVFTTLDEAEVFINNYFKRAL